MKGRLLPFRIIPAWIMGLPMLLALWCCGSMGTGKTNSSAHSGLTVRTLDFRPLTYFDRYCSRCHGPFGSYYGKDFARDLSPEALQQKVMEMVAGPGGAPLSGDSLAALVAFHHSLSTGKPFIVITEASRDSLIGEVTPGVPLRMYCGNQVATLSVRGYRWSVRKPPWLDNCSSGELRIAAGTGGNETILNPAGAAYSHPGSVR